MYVLECLKSICYTNFHQVTSIAAKHLFHLNAKTKEAVRELQSQSDYQGQGGYISLQLRMTDKMFEMSANTSNIVREMEPFFKDLNISQLYIGT